MNESETLAERLEYWMRERGVNGKRLANKTIALKAGLNETAIRDILNGSSKSPTLKTSSTMKGCTRSLPPRNPRALLPAGRFCG